MAKAHFLQPARASLVEDWVGYIRDEYPEKTKDMDIAAFADGHRKGYSVVAEIFANQDEAKRIASDAWNQLFTLGQAPIDQMRTASDEIDKAQSMISAVEHPGTSRNKIIAWSFIPTAIILLAVALVAYYAYQRSTVDLVIEQNRELARLSAGQVANEMAEYTGNLALLARTLSDFRDSPQGQSAALARAANRLVVFDGGVVFLNEHGEVLAAQPARPEIIGPGLVGPFLLSPHGPVAGSASVGSRERRTGWRAGDRGGGARLRRQGEFLGVLAGMFRLGAPTVSPFYGSLVKLRIAPNATAYLVDQHGEVIYHSDSQRVGEDFAVQGPVQEVLQGRVGAVRTRDAGGSQIVVSYAPVPGSPWGLVIEANWQALLRASRSYGTIPAPVAGARGGNPGDRRRVRGEAHHPAHQRSDRRGAGGGQRQLRPYGCRHHRRRDRGLGQTVQSHVGWAASPPTPRCRTATSSSS